MTFFYIGNLNLKLKGEILKGIRGMNKLNLPTLQLNAALTQQQTQGGGAQITTREEQEQYKIRGMQDGKVRELIEHEKRQDERREENHRKMLHKKTSKHQNHTHDSATKDKNNDYDPEELIEETHSDNE